MWCRGGKDYYETLGVPKTATGDEIKKAFRNLARQYHPDVAKEKKTKAAEAKFKEINEAYEVLGDPGEAQEIRHARRGLGARWPAAPPPNWQEFAQPARAAGGASSNFGGTGFSDFFEKFFGGRGAPKAARAILRFRMPTRRGGFPDAVPWP